MNLKSKLEVRRLKTVTNLLRRGKNMKVGSVGFILCMSVVFTTGTLTSLQSIHQINKDKEKLAATSAIPICLYGGYCISTANCVLGSQCNIQNQYYSQCVPDLKQNRDPSTGCISDYSSGCANTGAGLNCCNPGNVCNYATQCVPVQPPFCSMPTGYSLGPLPSQYPSSISSRKPQQSVTPTSQFPSHLPSKTLTDSPIQVTSTYPPSKSPSVSPTTISPSKQPLTVTAFPTNTRSSLLPEIFSPSQLPNITPTVKIGNPSDKASQLPSPSFNITNPFRRTANYYVNPTYQVQLQSSIATASGNIKTTLQSMLHVSSAYWIDVKAKINGLNTTSAEGILRDAARKKTKQLVTLIVYDLPNRDCHAKASNGEICCTYNSDGTCNYDAGGDCTSGIAEYQGTYIDPLHSVLSRYDRAVEIVLIIEPDSLPNLATNAKDLHCGNSATTAAYSIGIAYAVNKFKDLQVSMYLDGAHGGWLGWADNMKMYTELVVSILGPTTTALRGFATNVANYQPIGIMCPFQPSVSLRNEYCLSGQHQSDPCCADPCKLEVLYNPGNNELNYVNSIYQSFKAVLPAFQPHFVIDSGRNGVGNMRRDCANWCNIRGAGIGVPPTYHTAAPDLVDAYFWLKTPGESDGCTQMLPDGTSCPRFDSFCSSVDSIGSQIGEPRAPQAGQWFDYEIKQLASNALLSNYSFVLPTPPTPSNMPTVVISYTTRPFSSQSSIPTIFATPTSNFSSIRICLNGGYCKSNSDCIPGSKCNIQSQYYSQCVQDLEQYLAPSTGCVADYSSGCNIVGSMCCNPGYVCVGNSVYAQCAPVQPPLCKILSGFNIEPALTPSPSASASSPSFLPSTAFPSTTLAPNIKASSVLSTKNNQIVDSNGNSVRLTGINWFGYETHDAIVHGLWTRNYKSMLDQVKELNFNVLRIPFCNENLIAGIMTKSVDFNKNSDLVGLSSLETLDKIVAYSGSIGLRIFLDRHSAKAGNYSKEPLWYIRGDAYYTEDRFIADWVMLAKRYRGTAVIGADLWNEPKGVNGVAATWGTGDAATDWNLAAERAGNAILAVNPDWLIIVEGTALKTWWGGNLMGVETNPVVLKVPNKVVYSIHEYSQDVYDQPWFSDPSFPANLRPRWNSFWGYLFQTQTAPLLIGEFGTNFKHPNDFVWLPILLRYMAGQLMEDGRSNLVAGQQGMSWTFWCLNPNSGDTGGILLEDWVTVDSYKMSFLSPMLALPLP